MALEVVDYFLLFWFGLTVAVCTIGGLIEKQQAQARLKASRSADRNRSRQQDSEGRWPTDSGAHYSNSYSDQPSADSSWSKSARPQADRGEPAQYHSQASTGYSIRGQYGSQFQPTDGDFGQASADSSYRKLEAVVRDSHNSRDFSMSSDGSQRRPAFETSLGAESARPAADQTIPTATGFNADCVDWVNQILYLFYSQPDKYGPQIVESVYRSLNERLSNLMSQTVEYSELMIDFTGVNQLMTSRPDLTNIRTENESDKSLSAICKLYNKRIVFDLTIQRTRISSMRRQDLSELQATDDSAVAHYELILENLEGKLKSMAMLGDKLIVVQFLERPDTKISLRPKHQLAGAASSLISEDILVNMILQTLGQVVVDLYFGDEPDFPQFRGHPNGANSLPRSKLSALRGSANEIKRQIKHDFFGALSSSEHKERKLFLRILRAKNINYNQSVTCLLELDAPYQQALSATQQGSNPFWDEHFLFSVTDKSGELSVELWDSIVWPASELAGHRRSRSSSSIAGQGQPAARSPKRWNKSEVTAGGKFLGVARVRLDELRKSPVQKVSLALQSGSAGTGAVAMPGGLGDPVGGELQLELLFLEHAPSAGKLHKSGSSNSLAAHEGDVVSVDRKLTPSGYVITTTTIVKPTGQRSAREPRSERPALGPSQSPVSLEQSDLDSQLDVGSTLRRDLEAPTPSADGSEHQEGAGRGRSRSSSRSILRAIKKRFSFSRTRSKSVGESARVPAEPTPLEPTSLDDRLSVGSRSGASSELSSARAKSVPASREPSELPTIVINRSRLSDTASAFTFAHPKSQLVVECVEPSLGGEATGGQRGRLRYYAVPDDAASKRKWRRRGTKLHLFNEHQFVACHLAGSSTCHLCGRVFSRRPGKQGYKCRNCHLLSHKQCHVKVDHNCPYALRDGLKLEYIDAEPPASLVMDEEAALARQGVGPTGSRTLGAGKSVSVELDDT